MLVASCLHDGGYVGVAQLCACLGLPLCCLDSIFTCTKVNVFSGWKTEQGAGLTAPQHADRELFLEYSLLVCEEVSSVLLERYWLLWIRQTAYVTLIFWEVSVRYGMLLTWGGWSCSVSLEAVLVDCLIFNVLYSLMLLCLNNNLGAGIVRW